MRDSLIALTAARLAWRTMDFLLQRRHRPMTKGLDGAPAVGERCSKFRGAKKRATTTATDAAAPPRVAQTSAQVPLGTHFDFVPIRQLCT